MTQKILPMPGAVFAERNRFVRTLHDPLVRSLLDIGRQAALAERDCYASEELYGRLCQVAALAQAALADARHHACASLNTMPEQATLAEMLGNEVASWQQDSGITARLIIRGTGDVPLPVELAIVRIAQEALHNIASHAQATEACLELEFNPQDVRLLISDDGTGFAIAQHAQPARLLDERHGLGVMQTRAQAAGGRLRIKSWPGNGSRIEAIFPHTALGEGSDQPPGARRSVRQTRVLVVDGQALIRRGIAELLRGIAGLRVVGEAADGSTAIKQARQLRPDLVLIELDLPGIDGIATTEQLIAEHPNLRIIALTNSDDGDVLTRAMRAGVRGYVFKDSSVERLAETIDVVLRGEILIERRMANQLVHQFLHLIRDRHPHDCLSERELEVLRLLIDGRRNRQIAAALLVSEHTVKSHISNIFQKLGVTDRTSAVTVALQRNLGGMALPITAVS